MMLAISRRLTKLVFPGLALILLTVPGASRAGVINGVQKVADLTIYLGVVSAATVRAHAKTHPEALMHGGVPGRGLHEFHLVVALFKTVSQARVTNANVTAEIIATGGKRWSFPLQRMVVNGDLTFGSYAALPMAADYQIIVTVMRAHQVRGRHLVKAHFTFEHDLG